MGKFLACGRLCFSITESRLPYRNPTRERGNRSFRVLPCFRFAFQLLAYAFCLWFSSAATGLVPVERTFLHYFARVYLHPCLDAPAPPASVRRDKKERCRRGSAKTLLPPRQARWGAIKRTATSHVQFAFFNLHFSMFNRLLRFTLKFHQFFIFTPLVFLHPFDTAVEPTSRFVGLAGVGQGDGQVKAVEGVAAVALFDDFLEIPDGTFPVLVPGKIQRPGAIREDVRALGLLGDGLVDRIPLGRVGEIELGKRGNEPCGVGLVAVQPAAVARRRRSLWWPNARRERPRSDGRAIRPASGRPTAAPLPLARWPP